MSDMTMPAPSLAIDPTAQRALAINLDDSIYGSFSEIGAGQEVARWFFAAGGAAGTVAKTISAYDMTVSDAIYGKTTRYVSRERVERMLDHEYGLMHERLDPTRGDRTRFFALADTAAARSFAGGNECHAWMAIRFQHAIHAAASDVILHVRLLDTSNALQADALGRLGVNLVHAAFAHWRQPRALLETLLEHIGRNRLEIDWVRAAGPAFKDVDERLLGLHLVRIGYTPALLFDVHGTPLLASESIRRKRVLVERGRFAPVTSLNLEMLAKARAAFEAGHGAPRAGHHPANEPDEVCEIMEITMNNLRDRGNAEDSDFLARVDLITAAGKMVLVSDIGAFHSLGEYLADRRVEATGLVLGVPLLRELFNESHYKSLDGGILEAFGRLFTHGVRLYVYPTRDVITGTIVTAETLKVAPHLSHLLEHLRVNGLILGLVCDPATLRTYSSEEVRSRICSGDPSWRELVSPEVATHIDRHGYFGASCPVE
ncbi:MAG: TonB-dependent receptor [Planctomycetia bacterium]|nr:TonB-dependent receptor [Planctomycetia bacterium]